MKTKLQQYNEYLNNGGSMTLEEWVLDGRYDRAMTLMLNFLKQKLWAI